MKCLVAMMQHETNTFSPLATRLSDFGSGVGLKLPPSGEQAIAIYGKADFAFAGMLAVARARGADCVVPVTAYAEPGGFVDNKVLDYVSDRICDAIRQGCDAVLLDLHGAMVTNSCDDGEGELLRRIRAVSPAIPIAVALDFHTNLTSAMVDNCNVIDGYRTYPHIDMYATGVRAAQTLFHCMDQDIATRMSWRALPMMTHMIKQTPLRQPMKDIMQLAIEAVDNTALLNVSVFAGFPLADVPHVSLSALAVEPVDNFLGERLVNELCAMAWSRRHDFIFEPEPMADSIRRAAQLDTYPVVIADHGDNSGAGGSADDMSVLEEMLQQGLGSIIAGPFWDPRAVAQMIARGEGNEISLTIGGKTSAPSIAQPGHGLACRGKITRITDGRFILKGPMQTGLEVCLGRSAVLDTGAARILVCEERWEPYDPGCFTHAGLDPEQCRYILIKSRQHFRAGFESIASHIVLAAGPGVCSSDYSQFDFQRLARPVFPLDYEMTLPDSLMDSWK